MAVLSCLALATNGFPAQDKDKYVISGVFIPADAFNNLNNDGDKNNNNQLNNDAPIQIQQNSDQGVPTNSVLKINPTNQQPNQQPIIVRQSQPLQTVVAQPNQPQQTIVVPQNQPQPNQQGMYVVQPNQPNQQAVLYNPSNQQQVLVAKPSNQQQVLVAKPSNQQVLVSQPGQQAFLVTPGGQQTVITGQPNQVQVSPTGQQHGQAILVPKPGENNVYTFIPLNNQNNNQNQAVSNGNTIWVPVQ